MPKALRHFPNKGIILTIVTLKSANNPSIFYLPIFNA